MKNMLFAEHLQVTAPDKYEVTYFAHLNIRMFISVDLSGSFLFIQSSCPDVFYKRGVLKNFANLQEETFA